MFGLESGCRITNTTTSHNGFSLFEIHRRQKLLEKDFGRIQIDRELEMQKWADNIKTVEDERIKLAIIAANNHYAGFGPGTANVFRNMLGLPEAKSGDKGIEQEQEAGLQDDLDVKQSTLSDFLD